MRKDKKMNNKKKGISKKVCKFPIKNLAYQKNLDNIKLLFSHKPFREDLIKIRKNLCIPENGFTKDEEAQKWEVGTDILDDLSMNSLAFLNQEQKIAGKIESGEISQKMGNKQIKLLYTKLMCNYFTDSVNFLIEKFHIPYNYEQTIRRYVIFNEIMFVPAQNYAVSNYLFNKKNKSSKPVTINIYAKLTNEEIKQLKKSIERFGENLPEFQPLKNIDKRLELEEMIENRHYFNEVEQAEGEYKTSDIASDFFGNENKKKKVYDTKRDLRREREKRFGK